MAWVPDQTPIESGVTWADYVAAGGTVIPEAEWPRYCHEAWDIADDVTFDRASEELTQAEAVHAAIFRIADAIANETDVESKTLGRFSVKYKPGRMTPHSVARAALGKTGLTYSGADGL